METWDGVGTHALFPVETLRDQMWVLRGRDSQRRAVGRWPVRDTETPLHTDSWEVCRHTGTAGDRAGCRRLRFHGGPLAASRAEPKRLRPGRLGSKNVGKHKLGANLVPMRRGPETVRLRSRKCPRHIQRQFQLIFKLGSWTGCFSPGGLGVNELFLSLVPRAAAGSCSSPPPFPLNSQAPGQGGESGGLR